jgi:hypothetical protein
MRNELTELIRAIVSARFAVESVADTVIRDLRQGETTTYRGHKWGSEHHEAMERVHQGVEAAWQYAKWLQFPEVGVRLDHGFAALSRIMDVREIVDLTNWDGSHSVPAALESPGQDGKEPIMARATVADLEGVVQSLQETVDNHVETLNEQIAALEGRIDELEGGSDKRKTRIMTPEARKAAGERMQMGRVRKLGLDSIEQLRALKLGPGKQPTKAEIKKIKELYPAS